MRSETPIYSLLFGSLLPVILEGHAWAGVAWIQQHLYSRVNKKLEHFGKISFLIPYLVHRTKSWYFFRRYYNFAENEPLLAQLSLVF